MDRDHHGLSVPTDHTLHRTRARRCQRRHSSVDDRDHAGGDVMTRRRPTTLRGQTMVESAITLTVLLMLTIGVLDAGRAIWEYNTVAFLARDGARFGTVHTSSQTQSYVHDRCDSLLSDPCPSAPNFTVSVTPATCGSSPTPVIVTVTDRFQAVTPL